ncbi:2-oxo-4-hydroxy-4-carboxy-5-ureidoimidazoline decarboxylase [Marinimicrobium sp. ARAG 43.8]|uniref:2-oxo-4-hydroxy-4-carboxy-5-ureidoimidazoline decarboxylase n=1 Tax=Marinimicrobium sp. ARAG 43.8 TaxID=3418719 RepID=UPI003CEB3DEA
MKNTDTNSSTPAGHDTSMSLERLNTLPDKAAFALFLECCHSRRWADAMVAARPFTSERALLAEADRLWENPSEADILEAFSGHARIGDIELLRSKFAGRAMGEQGQVLETDESVLRELRDLNIDYEQRHGFIFIVCASGKPAETMLDLLKARIHNTRETELRLGAREQGAITRLRLKQLIQEGEPNA